MSEQALDGIPLRLVVIIDITFMQALILVNTASQVFVVSAVNP